MIFRFLWPFLKSIFQKLFHRNFQNILYLSWLPISHYEKIRTANLPFIGLEVLDDGPIFSGIVHCQERGSIICKHRRTEEAKTKVYIFVYKAITNSIFKIYTAIEMGLHALAKWSHYKVKLLQNSVISVLVIVPP